MLHHVAPCPVVPIEYTYSQQMSPVIAFDSCSGLESLSPVLRTGVYLKKWGGWGGSVVGRDGYQSS